MRRVAATELLVGKSKKKGETVVVDRLALEWLSNAGRIERKLIGCKRKMADML